MRSGRLDRRATLFRPTPTRKPNGAFLDGFTEVASGVPVSRDDSGGRAGFFSQRSAAERETIFEMRFRSDVAPIWQIVCEGKTYDVQRVDEIGRRDGLRVWATIRPAP